MAGPAELERRLRAAVEALPKGLRDHVLRVEVEADRNADPPRYFKAVRMLFFVTGVAGADHAKFERALELSHEKYCSVLHTLRTDMTLSTRLIFS